MQILGKTRYTINCHGFPFNAVTVFMVLELHSTCGRLDARYFYAYKSL